MPQKNIVCPLPSKKYTQPRHISQQRSLDVRVSVNQQSHDLFLNKLVKIVQCLIIGNLVAVSAKIAKHKLNEVYLIEITICVDI
jgi:hypothetical protein